MDARAASSTGLQPALAGALAYLAGPFSGILVLLAERTNQFVRFHAWQAILALGGLGLLAVTLLLFAFLGLFASRVAFRTLYVSSAIVAFVWLHPDGVHGLPAGRHLVDGRDFEVAVHGERERACR